MSSGVDLNLIPAGVPPAGQTSNLIDPVSLQPATIGIFATLIALATLAVTARVFFNYRSVRKFGADDLCAIGALIFSIAQSSIVLSISKTERHQWDFPVGWYTTSYIKSVYAQNMLAWPAIFLAKVAILLLFRRIFQVKKTMRIAIWIGIIWAVLTYLPNPWITSYYCAPHVGEQWSLLIEERCADPLKWEIASAVMSILLDVYILILPIPEISRLQLTQRRKIGILLVFTTSSFAIVCAVLTLVYRIKILESHASDASWRTAQLYICNGAENYTAIIVGCVPGISSFFRVYVAESKFYTSIKTSFWGSGSRWSKKSSHNDYATPKISSGRLGRTTFGGTPYDDTPGFESTSHLQGYHELKDTKVTTSVTRVDGRHGLKGSDAGGQGIVRSVGIEQSSTDGDHDV